MAWRLSSLSHGFSGADIFNVINESALLAIRKSKILVDLKDFE